MPHVLGQGTGIGLIVLEQPGRATLCLLDQLPMPLVGRVQEGTAHPQQILGVGIITVGCAYSPTLLSPPPGPSLCLDQPTFPSNSSSSSLRAAQALCLDLPNVPDTDSSPCWH